MQAVLYIVDNSMQTVSKVLEQKTVPFIASASPRKMTAWADVDAVLHPN